MQEILFLLLPLAFYSGWRAARRHNQQDEAQQRAAMPHNFVQGVNFLLNEQPDEALDIFLNYPHVDEHTADTLLSLGNMFRAQGEVNRALRVHQHLVARSDLSKQQRLASMAALGKDFFAAGLLDRAETVFKEVLTIEPSYQAVHEPLRHIYEQLHEWNKAIKITRAAQLPTEEQNRYIAHYLCEQVRNLLDEKQLYQATEKLKEAAKQDPNSARVEVLQGELKFAESDRQAGLGFYQKAVEKDARLLDMLVDRLLKRMNTDIERVQLFQFVESLYHDQNNAHLLAPLLKAAQESKQLEAVKPLLLVALQERLLSLNSLARAGSILSALEGEDSQVAILGKAIQQTAASQPEFQCEHCGYKMHDFLWRCPACHHWDSIANP